MPDAGILCGDMLLIQQKPVSAIHPGNLVLLEELHCRFTDFFCDIRTHHSDNSDNSDNSDPGMSSAASFTCAAAWHMTPGKNTLGLLKQRVRKKVFPTMP